VQPVEAASKRVALDIGPIPGVLESPLGVGGRGWGSIRRPCAARGGARSTRFFSARRRDLALPALRKPASLPKFDRDWLPGPSGGIEGAAAAANALGNFSLRRGRRVVARGSARFRPVGVINSIDQYSALSTNPPSSSPPTACIQSGEIRAPSDPEIVE